MVYGGAVPKEDPERLSTVKKAKKEDPVSERAFLGQTVLYRLNEVDVDAATLHAGNKPQVGQQLPAIVTADWVGLANLRVLLDGTGDIWVTSRSFGDRPGQWQHTSW